MNTIDIPGAAGRQVRHSESPPYIQMLSPSRAPYAAFPPLSFDFFPSFPVSTHLSHAPTYNAYQCLLLTSSQLCTRQPIRSLSFGTLFIRLACERALSYSPFLTRNGRSGGLTSIPLRAFDLHLDATTSHKQLANHVRGRQINEDCTNTQPIRRITTIAVGNPVTPSA